MTKNTLYLWEKAGKVSFAKRDRKKTRICTREWIEECIAFRDKVIDPNEKTTSAENTAG